ncbi:hypothetical protein [Nostoc sp. NOS(2021)]|nr:hypothetical protein [Nostoc sp. NOS(2021)]
MRVVAIAIDKLELMRSDRHRVANGVTKMHIVMAEAEARYSKKV